MNPSSVVGSAERPRNDRTRGQRSTYISSRVNVDLTTLFFCLFNLSPRSFSENLEMKLWEDARISERDTPVKAKVEEIGPSASRAFGGKLSMVSSAKLGRTRRRETFPDIVRRVPLCALRPLLKTTQVSAAKVGVPGWVGLSFREPVCCPGGGGEGWGGALIMHQYFRGVWSILLLLERVRVHDIFAARTHACSSDLQLPS